jgi:hypothetical protein
VSESYSISLLKEGRSKGKKLTHQGSGATHFDKPLDNIGNKTIADYGAYSSQFVYPVNVPGCSQPGRVFVGQRKDPFVVNLGETFDLVNLSNPLGAANGESDDLADKNVTAFALEIHKSCLLAEGRTVIGAWTTSSLPEESELRRNPGSKGPERTSGRLVQVSRLGNPLVNELVIGLKDKDRFNGSAPSDDAQFALYVTNPTLPVLLEILFGAAGVRAPTQFPRADLVQVFLTGVDGLNSFGAGAKAAEMMRLNTATPPVAKGAQNNLAVIGGDTAGYPNGRRPGDDVVDISLRVVMGKLLPEGTAPSGQLPFTDGAAVSAANFGDAFPYLTSPIPGSPSTARPAV